MTIEIIIRDAALPPPSHATFDGAGAVVVFDGIVRPTENGEPIEALEYQAYEPMAQNMMTRICEDLLRKHGILAMRVEHSRGRVAVGECSFRLVVFGRHRKESLAAADEFIDRLKTDVPIWKEVAGS